MDEIETGAEHLPPFITRPGEMDTLFVVVVVAVIAIVFMLGTLYFRLHALPEHMAHRSSRAQYQVVAILALLALFTHNTIFWIAALLLAAVQIPDLITPFRSIAQSLERMSGREGDGSGPEREDP
jgi:hypothetical protein